MGGYMQALTQQVNTGANTPQSLTATQAVVDPEGFISMDGGAAINITVPAPTAEQDGQFAMFYTGTAFAHVVTFTGAKLLSVGVAKTTSTSGGLVGEFLQVVARNGFWAVVSSAGQTFA
jgi:hypothetical protein